MMRRPSGTKIPHRSWGEGKGGEGVRGRGGGCEGGEKRGVRGRERNWCEGRGVWGEGEVTEVGIVEG